MNITRDTNRRSVLRYTGALSTATLVGLACCSTESGGGETPDALMVVGYPKSGVQLFKDYYADHGVDTFESPFLDESDYDQAGVFTSQGYDASAIQILANLLAGSNDGTAIRDHIRVVANPGGTAYTPSELSDAAEAAAAGENIQYEGASSGVNFDDAGDITSARYQLFGFTQDGVEAGDTIDFGGSGDIPEPEPSASGSDRTVRLGILQPEVANSVSLGHEPV